jgi:hypothetical protein
VGGSEDHYRTQLPGWILKMAELDWSIRVGGDYFEGDGGQWAES